MDEARQRAVHCAACSRLVSVADDENPGDEISCPFCGTRLRLSEMTVLTAQLAETED